MDPFLTNALVVKNNSSTALQKMGPQSQTSYLLTNNQNAIIKQGIWAYFLLLIFEGALRKWFLPGLATPLLVIRDPIALWLLASVWKKGLLPSNSYLLWLVLIGLLGIFFAILLGHGNLPIALFGARIFLLHFPLLFVIGRIFNRMDVIKMGKIVLYISIPMALLVIIQFYSSQSAWVNRGVGGDMEGAGFGGALGFYRAPATFSFTNGTHLFFGFVACFIFYFWLQPKEINRLLLIGATACLVIVIPFSISRSLLFHVVVSLVFALFAILKKPKYLSRMISVIFGGILALIFLSQTDFFQVAIKVFSSRFEDASAVEGGLEGTLGDRFLGGMISALSKSSEQPVFGYGLGMGSNLASKLLAGGRGFLLAEEEWARTIGELGPLIGLSFILLRLSLCAEIGLACYRRLVQNDLLPWMLLSFGILLLAQGQTAQPTALGFCTLIGGLILATLRESSQKDNE